MFLLKIIYQNSVSTCIKNICSLNTPPRFHLHLVEQEVCCTQCGHGKKKLAERSGGENFWNAKSFARARTM